MIYAPGFFTGYGVKTLPAVREAIEQKQWSTVDPQIARTAAAIEREADKLTAATKSSTASNQNPRAPESLHTRVQALRGPATWTTKWQTLELKVGRAIPVLAAGPSARRSHKRPLPQPLRAPQVNQRPAHRNAPAIASPPIALLRFTRMNTNPAIARSGGNG